MDAVLFGVFVAVVVGTYLYNQKKRADVEKAAKAAQEAIKTEIKSLQDKLNSLINK